MHTLRKSSACTAVFTEFASEGDMKGPLAQLILTCLHAGRSSRLGQVPEGAVMSSAMPPYPKTGLHQRPPDKAAAPNGWEFSRNAPDSRRNSEDSVASDTVMLDSHSGNSPTHISAIALHSLDSAAKLANLRQPYQQYSGRSAACST